MKNGYEFGAEFCVQVGDLSYVPKLSDCQLANMITEKRNEKSRVEKDRRRRPDKKATEIAEIIRTREALIAELCRRVTHAAVQKMQLFAA